jgi:hypothetical protein
VTGRRRLIEGHGCSQERVSLDVHPVPESCQFEGC